MSKYLSMHSRWHATLPLLLVACALVIIGAKCFMIDHYAGPTPFWDQWDAEGAILYPKFFAGTLHLSDLISPHNEHRILVTRLWSLLLLELGGYWDPLLQMVANTLLLAAVVVLLIVAFRPILDEISLIALAAFVLVVYSLPMGLENTLAGFNSQWYFVLLFSIAGLDLVISAVAFSLRWWTATGLAVISYFCLASGAMTLASASVVCMAQFIVGRRKGVRELLALGAIVAFSIVAVINTPMRTGDAPLRAHSVWQFFHSLLQIASWPAPLGITDPMLFLVLFAIFIHAPAVVTSIRVIKWRLPLDDHQWLIVALSSWLVLQMAAIAYGRAVAPLSSRYLDVFAVGLLVDSACLLRFLQASTELGTKRAYACALATAWLLVALVGIGHQVARSSLPEMRQARAHAQAQTKNLRAYLETGDIRALENKPFLDIPYPNAQRLAMIVSQPKIRAILPPALVGNASAAQAQQHGISRYTGPFFETVKRKMLHWGVLLIPIGLVLFALAAVFQIQTEKAEIALAHE